MSETTDPPEDSAVPEPDEGKSNSSSDSEHSDLGDIQVPETPSAQGQEFLDNQGSPEVEAGPPEVEAGPPEVEEVPLEDRELPADFEEYEAADFAVSYTHLTLPTICSV